MSDSEFIVVLFHTSNHAFRAEMLLKKAEVPCKLIPVPRHLSSDCGVCARVSSEVSGSVASLLEDSSVPTAGIHPL